MKPNNFLKQKSLLKLLSIVVIMSVLLVACGGGESKHEKHTHDESSGLINIASPSVDSAISAKFLHEYGKDGDSIMTAPISIITLNLSGNESTSLVIDFGVSEDPSDFVSKMNQRIANGDWPKSVSISMNSEFTYAEVLEQLGDESKEFAGTSSFNYQFESGSSISTGTQTATIRIKKVLEEFYPVPENPIAALHWNIFNCHSHWGFMSTKCHCKDNTCCPGETCMCKDWVTGWGTSCPSGKYFCNCT